MVPGLIPVHIHWVEAKKFDETEKSWYIFDGDKVEDAQGSVLVWAKLSPGNKANKGYPLAASWLGIEWPDIQASARAAWLNCCGNVGFPVHRSPFKDKKLWDDPVKTPIDAYIGGEEGRCGNYCPADGWNGGRWFAQLIKVVPSAPGTH